MRGETKHHRHVVSSSPSELGSGGNHECRVFSSGAGASPVLSLSLLGKAPLPERPVHRGMMAPFGDMVRFIANQLKCPICFDMFTEPVSLACGHSYCLQCIQDHVRRSVRTDCPQCRAQLGPDPKLHKNVTISAILELQEVGGRRMWDVVLTGSEEAPTQVSFMPRFSVICCQLDTLSSYRSKFHTNITH